MTSDTAPESSRWLPEAFVAASGDIPFERFIDGLPDITAVALKAAIDLVLAVRGIQLARTEWLKPLGRGLHEFRVRHDAEEIAHMFGEGSNPAPPTARVILLRLFVHFHGDRQILLLNGFDKASDPSQRRQRREIACARRLLSEFKTEGH
jgi:hypothetical protein